MKSKLLILFSGLFISLLSFGQCSICTKTASQLGEGPAKDLNAAIIYLMFTPLIIMGVIGYKWYKRNEAENQ